MLEAAGVTDAAPTRTASGSLGAVSKTTGFEPEDMPRKVILLLETG